MAGRVLKRSGLLLVVGAVVALASPARAVQLPRCGDGVVQRDNGEECDTPDSPCCDVATCKFTLLGTTCGSASECAMFVCNGQGTCLNLAKSDATECDDGNPCTTADRCVQGFCAGGPARDCDDDNGCTDDACDPDAADVASACQHTPNDDPCDDGLFCDGADVCAGGVCTHGGDPCASGTECNRACNETARDCQDPAGTACHDDGNPCTDDTCNGDGSCLHPNNAAPCDDGIFCNGADLCQNGQCAHAGDPCANGTPCDRSCNEAARDCISPAGTACPDDGNVCTDDTCDGHGNCGHVNNTAPCDDGTFCNGADTCKDGACAHAGDPCAAGPACDRTCNEAAHDCHDAAGAACPDDGKVCTDDTCDGQGACTHPDNTAACDDGKFCNGADTCKNGECTDHAGNPCENGAPCDRMCNEAARNCLTPAGDACPDDGNVCTDDACDGQGNCHHAANTAACDDGTFCNGADTCRDGVCQHAGDPCAGRPECDGVCGEQARSCHAPADTVCGDDTNACTVDVCDGAGRCTHPAAPPTPVTLSVSDASNTSNRFCVDVSLLNCATDLSSVQGILRAPGAAFTLAAGSVTCSGLPAGFQCRASQTADGVKFVVVPPIIPPTCIGRTGGTPIVHLCLEDTDPVCSGGTSVALELAQIEATDCAGADAAPVARNGRIACGGLRGDCNADGMIDAADLLAQIEVALQNGTPTAQQKLRCDADCDGDVDIFDMRDESDAIRGNLTPPLTCSLGSTAAGASHVAMRATSVVLANRDGAVRGLQLTFVPKGGAVTVTGVRATKRTQGFNIVYRQLDPNGPVRVLIVSTSGKTIPRGAGRIAKLAIGRGRHRGRLHLTDVRVAR